MKPARIVNAMRVNQKRKQFGGSADTTPSPMSECWSADPVCPFVSAKSWRGMLMKAHHKSMTFITGKVGILCLCST